MSFEQVSKDEFERFLGVYPRRLDTDLNQIGEPPVFQFYDFSLEGDDQKVAYAVLNSRGYRGDPNSPHFDGTQDDFYVKADKK